MIKIKNFALLVTLTCVTLFAGGASAYQINWRYTDSQSLNVNPFWEYYSSNVGFDMLGYARNYAVIRGGSWSSVRVYVVSNNAYGWKMKYFVPSKNVWRTTGFDMLAVAQWQGRRNYGQGKMKNWGVYFTNFNNPYSWKGAYINRIY